MDTKTFKADLLALLEGDPDVVAATDGKIYNGAVVDGIAPPYAVYRVGRTREELRHGCPDTDICRFKVDLDLYAFGQIEADDRGDALRTALSGKSGTFPGSGASYGPLVLDEEEEDFVQQPEAFVKMFTFTALVIPQRT